MHVNCALSQLPVCLADGLYTAPTDAALAYDIEVTKHIGMNMLRKHVKVGDCAMP